MSHRPAITVAELAERLGAAFSGDGARVIRDLATLEEAGPETISWVGTPKLMPRAAKSRAGALLIPQECSPPPDRAVIQVADPDAALIEVLHSLAPAAERVPAGVDPTAKIGPGAVVEGAAVGAHVFIGAGTFIGEGTQLHPGVYVGAHARIGRDCVLWPNVVIRERVSIGDRVVIHPNATIGGDGFGYLFREGRHRKIPQIGSIVIEDDVEIGSNSAIDRARSGVTRIGRGTKIDNLVQIAHNCDIGEHCIIVGQAGMGGSTSLGQHVILGGRVGVKDHVKLGNGVQVAAGAKVYNDIQDNLVVSGTPAQANRRNLREFAAVHRLPELLRDFRRLLRRVEDLEAVTGEASR